MSKFAKIKRFASSLDKVCRYFTNGRFNSSEIAMFSVIKDEEKIVPEIAEIIGVSLPTVHSILATATRKKYVSETKRHEDKRLHYKWIDNRDIDVCSVLFEGMTDEEVETFIRLLDQVNRNIDSKIHRG